MNEGHNFNIKVKLYGIEGEKFLTADTFRDARESYEGGVANISSLASIFKVSSEKEFQKQPTKFEDRSCLNDDLRQQMLECAME